MTIIHFETSTSGVPNLPTPFPPKVLCTQSYRLSTTCSLRSTIKMRPLFPLRMTSSQLSSTLILPECQSSEVNIFSPRFPPFINDSCWFYPLGLVTFIILLFKFPKVSYQPSDRFDAMYSNKG
jgi:hypothetical protein